MYSSNERITIRLLGVAATAISINDLEERDTKNELIKQKLDRSTTGPMPNANLVPNLRGRFNQCSRLCL